VNEPRTPDPDDSADLRALLGAYALDAVDPDEAAALEQHLLDDQDARAELHALQLGAGWLRRSAQRPSASTWAAIADEMERDLASDGPAAIPLRRRPSVVTRTLALAAAFVAAIAVAGGIRTALVEPAAVGDAALTSALADARARPGTQAVSLETTDGRGAVEAVVLEDGAGLALPKDLAPLDERRTYQLWAISTDGPVSLGTLGAEPGAHAFRLARGVSALAVTEEPRGGSPQPTGVPVATGDLRPV